MGHRFPAGREGRRKAVLGAAHPPTDRPTDPVSISFPRMLRRLLHLPPPHPRNHHPIRASVLAQSAAQSSPNDRPLKWLAPTDRNFVGFFLFSPRNLGLRVLAAQHFETFCNFLRFPSLVSQCLLHFSGKFCKPSVMGF